MDDYIYIDTSKIVKKEPHIFTICCSTDTNRKTNLKIIDKLEKELSDKNVILKPEFLNLDKLVYEDRIEESLEKLGLTRISVSDLVIFITKSDRSFGKSTKLEFNNVIKNNKNFILLYPDDDIDEAIKIIKENYYD